jgi:hypothetical protein
MFFLIFDEMSIFSRLFINGACIMKSLAKLIDHMLNVIIDFIELLMIGVEVGIGLIFRDCFSM